MVEITVPICHFFTLSLSKAEFLSAIPQIVLLSILIHFESRTFMINSFWEKSTIIMFTPGIGVCSLACSFAPNRQFGSNETGSFVSNTWVYSWVDILVFVQLL